MLTANVKLKKQQGMDLIESTDFEPKRTETAKNIGWFFQLEQMVSHFLCVLYYILFSNPDS